MDFNQNEYESLVAGLQAREERIIEIMQQMFETIPQETKDSRVEKTLKEMYEGWRALQESRQLQKRIQRTLEQPKSKSKGETNVRALNNLG